MSAPYSNLPALRLPIGNSACRRFLLVGLYACLVAVVPLALSRGAMGVALAALAANWLLVGVSYCARSVPWEIAEGRQGQWRAHTAQGEVQMLPRGAPTMLPLVVHLPFRRVPGGENIDVWVFRDAVSPQSWRQLRVRLNVRWHSAGER